MLSYIKEKIIFYELYPIQSGCGDLLHIIDIYDILPLINFIQKYSYRSVNKGDFLPEKGIVSSEK